MSAPRQEYEAQYTHILGELTQVAPEPLRSQLAGLIQPAITLATLPLQQQSPPLALATSQLREELLPLASKFGGVPDVPSGFEWPCFQGQPLCFVGQLNLEELAPFDLEERLPSSGLLSFWISGAAGSANNFGGWRVFHFEGETWQRGQAPHNKGWWSRLFRDARAPAFPPTPVEAGVWASVASMWGAEFQLGAQRSSGIAANVYDALGGAGQMGHQMFGFPDCVQNDVRDECASQWNLFLGTDAARSMGLSNQESTSWKDWELLLQISEDENASMRWGDGGAIYFLIRRVDLEAGRFERCWFMHQFD